MLVLAGLDARAAAIVMHSVKAVAAAGHTVMVTIHQPSIQIFEAFDTLLLLQVGCSMQYGMLLCYDVLGALIIGTSISTCRAGPLWTLLGPTWSYLPARLYATA